MTKCIPVDVRQGYHNLQTRIVVKSGYKNLNTQYTRIS